MLREKADMELLKATLSPDSAVLSIAYTTPDYLAKSEREKLTVYIKKEPIVYEWGKQFRLPSWAILKKVIEGQYFFY